MRAALLVWACVAVAGAAADPPAISSKGGKVVVDLSGSDAAAADLEIKLPEKTVSLTGLDKLTMDHSAGVSTLRVDLTTVSRDLGQTNSTLLAQVSTLRYELSTSQSTSESRLSAAMDSSHDQLSTVQSTSESRLNMALDISRNELSRATVAAASSAVFASVSTAQWSSEQYTNAETSTAVWAAVSTSQGNAEAYTNKQLASVVGVAVPLDPDQDTVVDMLAALVAKDSEVDEAISDLDGRLDELEREQVGPRDCAEVYGNHTGSSPPRSQIYTIYPNRTLESKTQAYCEFSFRPPGSNHVNVAINKPAYQSSTPFVNEQAGQAFRAVDGKSESKWSWDVNLNSCTHTSNEVNPWWFVDLGTEQRITEIAILNRGDCCGDRLSGFQIRIGRADTLLNGNVPQAFGELGSTWVECIPRDRPSFGALAANSNGEWRTFKCSQPIVGQYVSIGMFKTATLTLCEVQVYADDAYQNEGPWTVIASQPYGLFQGNLSKFYDISVPTPTTAGVLGTFWRIDLKQFKEVYVQNNASEYYIFKMADFTDASDPLILDPPALENWIAAAHSHQYGIIYGNNYPVVNHYQVGQYCQNNNCFSRITSTGQAYSYGVLAVFDWSTAEGTSSKNGHAHFGGTPTIEQNWAFRGTLLMVR